MASSRPVEVEADDGAKELVAKLPAGRLALDDAPFPLWHTLAERPLVDAATVLAPAKLTKTLDELECTRQAQAINGARCVPSGGRPPGALATDLSGEFLRSIVEPGATSNTVDPVFQVMPPRCGRSFRRRPAIPCSPCRRDR